MPIYIYLLSISSENSPVLFYLANTSIAYFDGQAQKTQYLFYLSPGKGNIVHSVQHIQLLEVELLAFLAYFYM